MPFTIHYGYLYGAVNIFMTHPHTRGVIQYVCMYLWMDTFCWKAKVFFDTISGSLCLCLVLGSSLFRTTCPWREYVSCNICDWIIDVFGTQAHSRTHEFICSLTHKLTDPQSRTEPNRTEICALHYNPRPHYPQSQSLRPWQQPPADAIVRLWYYWNAILIGFDVCGWAGNDLMLLNVLCRYWPRYRASDVIKR